MRNNNDDDWVYMMDLGYDSKNGGVGGNDDSTMGMRMRNEPWVIAVIVVLVVVVVRLLIWVQEQQPWIQEKWWL